MPEAILQSRSYQRQSHEHGERRSHHVRYALHRIKKRLAPFYNGEHHGVPYRLGYDHVSNRYWYVIETKPPVVSGPAFKTQHQAEIHVRRVIASGGARVGVSFGNSSRRQRVVYRGFEIRSAPTSHRGKRIYEAGIHAADGHVVGVVYDRTRPYVLAAARRKIDRALSGQADVSRFPPYVVQYRNREGQARSLSAYDVTSARRLLRKAKKIDPRATLHGEP